MNEGFYKLVGNSIVYAHERVITPDGTFFYEDKENYQYPIAGGWYAFATVEDAEAYFNAQVDDVPKVNGVPIEITRFQALAVLEMTGKLDAIEEIMQNQQTPKLTRLAYRNALTFKRDSTLVNQMAGLIGLNDAGLDQLFIQGAKINV